MAIFTIGDLHLGFSVQKPMDIFGDNWKSHDEQIKDDWLSKVSEADTVILPGDFSWGIDLEEAKADFDFLNSLPGTKILSKGNHDYWWTTLSKMNAFVKENEYSNIFFLHNNSYLVENKIICGTRGWITNSNSGEDYKILKRENDRLKLSIDDGIKNFGLDENGNRNSREIIAFIHYPPFFKDTNISEEFDFRNTLKEYNIKRCYYAHLHGEGHKEAIEGLLDDGITYKLVSSDYLGFKLIKID